MRTPLLFVAASGLAREAAAAVWAGQEYEPIGYLDDNTELHGRTIDGLTVLGGIDRVSDHPDAAVLLCAGRGAGRARLTQRLGPARYATVIHPSVSIGAGSDVGEGSILLAGCVLTASVRLGRHVVAMPNVVFTHDDVVADYATLTAGVALAGGVRIGERAYLGTNCAVRENLAIGADAVIGMSAAVVADVPAGETWVGVPARRMDRS